MDPTLSDCLPQVHFVENKNLQMILPLVVDDGTSLAPGDEVQGSPRFRGAPLVAFEGFDANAEGFDIICFAL